MRQHDPPRRKGAAAAGQGVDWKKERGRDSEKGGMHNDDNKMAINWNMNY